MMVSTASLAVFAIALQCAAAGIVYLGCYLEGGDRIMLPWIERNDPLNSPATCTRKCFEKGYKMAGVQFTVECFCANAYRWTPTLRPDSECNMTCPGDSKYMCGGFTRLSVYSSHACDKSACQNGATCSNGAGMGEYSCKCVAGWTGTNCEINIDECAPRPCQNGGACADLVNGYTCKCAAGFNGNNCETNINECAPIPCKNGATCVDGINAYTCSCDAGWNGKNCDQNINECSPNPCLNGATCTDGINAYACGCVAGWNGKNCEQNINECSPNPCQNGATCTDGINAYTCTCVAGWTGKNCDQTSGGHCPDGFVQFERSCYHFSNDNLPWISSQVACNQAFLPTKANLVEINNQTENHFLWQHAQATKKDYWVGASDWHITGVYRWIGSGKVVSAPVSYWAPGEPHGGTEHCMAISRGAGTSNCWYDQDCKENLNFICETPAK